MNFNQFIQERAARFGDKTSIVCGETRYSYADLDRATNRFANYLREKGLKNGDRVAILLPNSMEFIVSYLGAVRMGAVAVPLDARYKPPEMFILFNQCQPAVVIAESDCLEQLIPILPTLKSVKLIIEVGSRYPGHFSSFAEIMERASAAPVDDAPDDDDLAHIGYTSGPTSHPHGVMFTHGNMVIETGICARGLRLTEDDALMLFALPMHHVFGLAEGMLATLVNGGKVVILPGLSLGTLMELTEKEKGTIFMGVPYVYVLMVRLAEQEGIKHDISSLRLCISAGSCLPDRVSLRFRELYGLDVGQIYGLTESCAAVTSTVISDTWKLGSAGRAIPGWQMKIVDDSGRDLPRNQPGEVLVKGPMMKGYYRNPEDTAAVITPDGWLHTGDIGKIDKDGDLFILGLKKRMIIVKGQNIWPLDIEGVIKSHPQVADAAAIGIPDELRGEIVGAAVSPKKGEILTEDEIKRVCRQNLINYKIPKRIVFIDRIPRSKSGEPLKNELLELFARSPVTNPDSG